jgi:hypothetical protein
MYFVYKITNNTNGKYYIGVHKSEDRNDSYMGSGLAIKAAIKKYGHDNFSKIILEEHTTAEAAYASETKLVDMNDSLSYNINNGGHGGWDYVNSIVRDNCMLDPEVANRVGDAIKQTRNTDPDYYNKLSRDKRKKAHAARLGSKDSAYTKEKRADSLKEYYKNNDHVNKGKTLTEEEREKISKGWSEDKRQRKSEQQKKRIAENPDIVKTNTGKKFSSETKQKMSDSFKKSWVERKKKLYTCPHCDKIGGVNIKRWHFDNCKYKEKT